MKQQTRAAIEAEIVKLAQAVEDSGQGEAYVTWRDASEGDTHIEEVKVWVVDVATGRLAGKVYGGSEFSITLDDIIEISAE